MNYCLRYDNNSKYLDKADELIITESQNKLQFLKDFLAQHQNQKIIYYIPSFLPEHIDVLKKENFSTYSNLVLLLSDTVTPYKFDKKQLKSMNIPYISFDFADNYDTLKRLIDYGVSEVYITNGLGFELKTVKKICDKANVKIRAFVNVAQSSYPEEEDHLKFFIRPEDIEIFSSYIDTIDFWGEKFKQDTYYEIYAQDKKWYGPLSEIIMKYHGDLDNRFIDPLFALKRINCGRRCIKGETCQWCANFYKMSKDLEKKGIIISKGKEKEEE